MLPQDIRDRFPSWSVLQSGYPPKLFTHLSQHLEAELLEQVRATVTSPLRLARLARLTSLQGPHAGDWLTVAPSSPHMQLSETEWRIAAAVRLGLPIPHLSSSLTCTCNSLFTDPSIHSHVLRCPSNNEPTKVHDAIKREVHRIALELGFSAQMEDQHLLPGRRTDITCRDISSGTTWALDVSVADPQKGFPHSNAATVIGSAAATRESEKTTYYAAALRDRPDVKLFPLVIETFGCFGSSFNNFLRQCSRRGASQVRDLSGATDSLPQLFETNFYKRISLVHQREQARTVCRRAQIRFTEGINHTPPESVPSAIRGFAAFEFSETYKFVDLPFCQPGKINEKHQSLGEVLNGDRMVQAPYDLKFRVNHEQTTLCKRTLAVKDVLKFRDAVLNDYYFQMYLDALPIWGFIGRVDMDSDTYDKVDSDTYDKVDSDTYDKVDSDTYDKVDSDTYEKVDSDTYDKVDSDTHDKVDSDTHDKVDSDTHDKVDSDTHDKVDSDTYDKVDSDTHDTNQHISIFTHIHFDVGYNDDRVVEIGVATDAGSMVELDNSEDKEMEVEFTYSASWRQTDMAFEKRMDRYTRYALLPQHVERHWFSILNSCFTVLLLAGFIASKIKHVLKSDLIRYSHEEQEEAGWKSIHADVFRFPENKELFCAVLGSGTQLLFLVLFMFFLTLVGVLYPFNHGASWTALVVIYALTSGIAGYTSASFLKQMEGTSWARNIVLTGCVFGGPVVISFCCLNTVATLYHSTNAKPFTTIITLTLIWALIALPLLVAGTIAGKKSTAAEFLAPYRHSQTSNYPRAIPVLPWYRHTPPQMALAGFLPFSAIFFELYYICADLWGYKAYTIYGILFIVFINFIVVAALMAIVLTYNHLAAGDHEWWWRSVLCGGSPALFIFGYCCYYYHAHSDMSGFMQASFYFVCMACVCYGLFLMLGTVGFCASLALVCRLYRSIQFEFTGTEGVTLPLLPSEASAISEEASVSTILSLGRKEKLDFSGIVHRDRKFSRTPPLGWNSWNHFQCNINEDIVKAAADKLVSSGLAALGYVYVNIDDCWQADSRDSEGRLAPSPRYFPSGIKAIADYVHSKGLKLGIYSDSGKGTCADYVHSKGLKLGIYSNSGYTTMRNALEATGRDIFFSMCEWGQDDPSLWAYEVADSWRTTVDIGDSWRSMIRIADKNNKWAKYAKPGGWNDPDMLQVGNGGMRQSEYRVHFSLWAIMKAPLLIGCDLSVVSNRTLAILGNEEIIALNQDSLGVQARKVQVSEDALMEVWSGPLSEGRQVVALVNRSPIRLKITARWKAMGLNPVQRMYARDLWKKATMDLVISGQLSAQVASHDVALFILWPAV
ncbi:unnamed protein product [Closterium sp. Yama58-4]|nr:unnamed protein product [Closterium sp. Yama58-4]